MLAKGFDTSVSGKLAFLLPDMRGGGAERVVLRLIRDFVARGYEVDLLLMAAKGELMPLLPSHMRVIDLNAPRIRDAFIPLVRYFWNERPQAIQVSMWPVTVIGVLAHRVALSRARILVSEHTILSKQYAWFSKPLRTIMKASIRLAYPLADVRIAVSTSVAQDLAHLSGIALKEISVVHNPVGRLPQNATNKRLARMVWGNSHARILSVGSLRPAKNHALLIEAFAQLRKVRAARLVILGEGVLRENLERLIAAHGLTSDVILPGFLTDPWPFYDTAQIFVSSSDYEGYGNVLVEAMRSGLSVVSTDCIGGPSEILASGLYGRLVPCGDAGALAKAMIDALDRPVDSGIVKARAESISGQETSDRYLALMIDS